MPSDCAVASAVAALPYRSFFEHSPHAKLVVDRASLRVFAANAAALRTYGYSEAEMDGLPVQAIWPRAEEVLTKIDAELSRPELRTWRHRRKDGALLEVSIAIQNVAVGGRPAAVLHISDVSERAFSVSLLEAHGEVLERIARGAELKDVLDQLVLVMERLAPGMIGSVLLREDGRARHGAAPHLPPEYWCAIDGLAIGPGVGSCGTAMHTREAVIVADIATDPLWQDYRDLALRHGLRACWSAPIFSRPGEVLGAFALYYREPRAPSGRELRIVHMAAQLASVAIERDVADRAIAASERRLRAILDHAPAVVFVKDLDGRYLLVNRRFEQLARRPAAEIQGATARDIFPPALADVLTANDRRAAEAGSPIAIEEEMALDNGRRVFLSAKFPLLDDAGEAYAVCGIATDITDRKRAERELETSHAELRALSRQLQSVRDVEQARISREIHDELGQLLTGLSMNQRLLLRDLRAAGPPCEEAAAQLESMQELVRRLIASVRRIATDLRPEVLDALGIAAALEWQAAEFSRRTGIGCQVRLSHPSLQLDAERSTALFRIFQEAISNVARHSGATRVIAQLRRTPEAVVLAVADNGRGIVPTGEAKRPALGLLGMRERAAILGGEVRIDGLPGRGTTVTVRLPL